MTLSARLVLPLCLLPLLGCPRKGGNGAADASADAGPVAVVDAGPEASNEAKLSHYADERAIDHESATVKSTKALALTAVPKGDVVGTLKAGDSVTEVSEHNGYFLVLFPDPSAASRKLGGWVQKFAFMDAPLPHKAKLPKCTDGQFLVSDKVSPLQPRCSKICVDDADCPSAKCETAIHLDDKGNANSINGVTEAVPVCSVPAVKDGGVKPAAVAVPKCTPEETLYAVGEHAPIFCAKGDSCSADKDCKGKGTCVDAIVMQDDGQPARTMHGSPMGDKICKPK